VAGRAARDAAPDLFTRLLARSGWDFGEGGRPRAGCGTAPAFELGPAQGEQKPIDGVCPWCGGALCTAIDVNTADPRVGAALVHTVSQSS
jgi:hypothetical protein